MMLHCIEQMKRES